MIVEDPIIGYRRWRVDFCSGGLLPMVHLSAKSWDGGKAAHARCRGVGHRGLRFITHQAPHPDCDCGLYAWHRWAFVKNLAYEHLNNPHPIFNDSAFGAVLAWGRIEVHPQGFRAEYAKPVVLANTPGVPLRLRKAIRICDVGNMVAVASEYGSPLTKDQIDNILSI